MREETKRFFLVQSYRALFLFIILSMSWLGYYVISNKTAFVENPFVYGAETYKEHGYHNISCSCDMIRDSDAKYFRIEFNDTTWHPIPSYTYFDEPDFNFKK